jgi:hypothetical protein
MSMLALLAILAGLRAAFWRVAALRRARRSVFRTARRIRAEQHGEILAGTLVRVPRMPARPRRLGRRLPRPTKRQLALVSSGTLLAAVLIVLAILVVPWARNKADHAAVVHHSPAAPRALQPILAPTKPHRPAVARHHVRSHERGHATSPAPQLPSSSAPPTSTVLPAVPAHQKPSPAPAPAAPSPAPIHPAPRPASPSTGGVAPVPAPPASQ